MTKQQTFDIVARHLIRQGTKALLLSGHGCAYRGQDGTRCAAGCLIPDDLYTEEMEGSMISFTHGLAGKVIQSLGHDISLVRRLQYIHDQRDPETWGTELWDLSRQDELSPLAIYNWN